MSQFELLSDELILHKLPVRVTMSLAMVAELSLILVFFVQIRESRHLILRDNYHLFYRKRTMKIIKTKADTKLSGHDVKIALIGKSLVVKVISNTPHQ